MNPFGGPLISLCNRQTSIKTTMKNKFVIVTSLCIFAQSSVWGQDSKDMIEPAPVSMNNGSFYGSLAGGVAFFQDGNVDVKKTPSGDADFEFDTGSSFSLRLGYDFGSLRLEAEYNHVQADVTSLSTDTGSVSVDSEFSGDSFMANALWDFDFKSFVFSAGVGIGASKTKYDEMENSGFVAVAESEATVLSGQLILSAAYNINEKASLGISYRYLMMSDLNDSGYVDTGGAGKSDIDFDATDASVVELFFSYRF